MQKVEGGSIIRMMKLQAETIDEFFVASGEREPELRQLDQIIQSETGIKPELFAGMNITVLGYGVFHYKYASGREGDWPLIALAPQKNYISLYICALEDGEYLAEKYQAELGKVSCGKSCIRFKKLADLDQPGIRRLLRKTSDLHKRGKVTFGV